MLTISRLGHLGGCDAIGRVSAGGSESQQFLVTLDAASHAFGFIFFWALGTLKCLSQMTRTAAASILPVGAVAGVPRCGPSKSGRERSWEDVQEASRQVTFAFA